MTTRSESPRHRILGTLHRRFGGRAKGGLALAGVWLLLLSSLGLSTSIQQPTAVFIETHLEDQMSLQDYWHAAVSFREIGFKANLISPYTGYSSVSPENLSGFVEALIITPRDAARFVNDVDTFADYVAKGNGLIIAGQSASEQYEPWAREAVNLLAAKFGIEFENDLVCDPTSPYLNDSRYPHWPMITRFADHNVTEGVSRISYHAGCSLRIWGNATAVAWTSDEAWSDLDGDRTYDPDEERGKLVVDSGAALALRKHKRSLLAAGIRQVGGEFQRGDIVDIYDSEGAHLGCGITNYSSSDIATIKGAHSRRIATLLDHDYGSEVVHRNNLVVL